MDGRVAAGGRVEVAFGETGVLGYVIDDGVGDDDVVVYEWEAGFGPAAVAAEDGETADGGAGGANDVFGLGVGD